MNVKVFSADKSLVVEDKGYKVPVGEIDIELENSLKECFNISEDGYCEQANNSHAYIIEYNAFKKFIEKYPNYKVSTETDRKKLGMKFKFPYIIKEDVIELSPTQKVAIDNILKSNKIKNEFIFFVNRHINAIKDITLSKDRENTIIVKYYITPIRTFTKKYNRADLEMYLLKYGFVHFYKHAKSLINIPRLYDLANNELTQLLEYDIGKFYNIVNYPKYKVIQSNKDFEVLSAAFISVAEHLFKIKYNGKIYDLLIEYFDMPEVETEYYDEDAKYPNFVYYEGNLKYIFAFNEDFDTEEFKEIAKNICADNFRKAYDIFSSKSYAQAIDYAHGEFVYVNLFDYYFENRPIDMLA